MLKNILVSLKCICQKWNSQSFDYFEKLLNDIRENLNLRMEFKLHFCVYLWTGLKIEYLFLV